MDKFEKGNVDDEDRKIKQLLKEKLAGKSDDGKLEWMYKAAKVDREDYLLGKKVTSLRELDDHEVDHQEKKDVPGAIFDEEVVATRVAIDMNTKMREDPLFAMRKKEEDQRKKLIQNPVKMKMLQKQLEEMKSREKGKHKKKKKKKKHGRHDDSSSSDSDDELVKKYLQILEQKKQGVKAGHKKEQSEDLKKKNQYESRSSKYFNQPKPRSSRSRSRSPRMQKHGRSRSRSPPYQAKQFSSSRRKSRSPMRRGSRSPGRRRARSRSPRQRIPSRPRSPPRRRNSRSTSPANRRRRSRSRSPQRKIKSRQEEMEEKRRRMMEDAKDWEEERKNKVAGYKAADEKEARDVAARNIDTADFVNPMMSKHASHSSLEDRLKRNKYNIQRTKADLDKDFTKR